MVELDDFAEARALSRGVPARRVRTAGGEEVLVATTFDLLMAQYGVPRGLEGDYPADYDDEDKPYTPARDFGAPRRVRTPRS